MEKTMKGGGNKIILICNGIGWVDFFTQGKGENLNLLIREYTNEKS
jgi:hypothetical protein